MNRFAYLGFAIIALVAANLSSSLSDVAVKLLEGGISPFQYIFIRQVLSTILLLPCWLIANKSDRPLKQAAVTLSRAQLVLIGSGCLMVALTYLPLATANAIFYAAPLIMLPLSVWLLNEKAQLSNIVATAVGFVGVLLVLRPSQFHWAAIFALGCALSLALFNLLVKKLPVKQPLAITLFWTNLLSLPIAAVLALFFWQALSWFEFMLIAVSALFTLGYQAGAVFAYKRAPASQLGMIEYTGLIFVTLLGMFCFDEYPDPVSLIGILLIVLPIILKAKIKGKKEMAYP